MSFHHDKYKALSLLKSLTRTHTRHAHTTRTYTTRGVVTMSKRNSNKADGGDVGNRGEGGGEDTRSNKRQKSTSNSSSSNNSSSTTNKDTRQVDENDDDHYDTTTHGASAASAVSSSSDAGAAATAAAAQAAATASVTAAFAQRLERPRVYGEVSTVPLVFEEDGIAFDNCDWFRCVVADQASADAVLAGSKYGIFRLSFADGVASLVAGSSNEGGDVDAAVGADARFNIINGIALSPCGQTLFVSDTDNNKIKRVEVSTGATTTLAGSTQGDVNGVGSAAKFNYPRGLALSSDGQTLFVCDSDNHKIKRV